jgi:potassium/sodium efflux P-type ATPase
MTDKTPLIPSAAPTEQTATTTTQPPPTTTSHHVVFGANPTTGTTPPTTQNPTTTARGGKSIRSAREVQLIDPSLLSKTERGNPHALDATLVCRILETDPVIGLTEQRASELLREVGPNKLAEKDQETFLHKVWRQLRSVLILILIIAAIVSGALQEWAEFGLILGVVAINTVIGLVQEGKAERATAALKSMLSNEARVIRGGKNITIKAETLVPGDVVELRPGDMVPADLRLISVSNLAIEEAPLTGEAEPVVKNIKKVDFQTGLADRDCMAYSGTGVKTGKGTGVVVATGDTTQLGLINMMAATVEEKPTELQKQVDQFGWWVAIIIIPLAIASFLLAFFTGETVDPVTGQTLSTSQRAAESFVVAIAIAVAVVPEGLPAILSITLALGQHFMAQQKAIVKTLPAVETLGSVMVVCSDKTGTLTRNQMTVVGILTSKTDYKVTGIGYLPKEGTIVDPNNNNTEIVPTDSLSSTILTQVVLATDANSLTLSDNLEQVLTVGNPTEAAIVVSAWKAKVAVNTIRSSNPRLCEIPFDSEYKFMATYYNLKNEPLQGENKITMLVKGAPDRVFAKCSTQFIPSTGLSEPMNQQFWTDSAATFSDKGLRCIAFARAFVNKDIPVSELSNKNFVTEAEPFLDMLCVFAIMDPPRPECMEACKLAKNAGITVKMITGDHPTTATAIGRELGIVDEQHNMSLTGPDIDIMSREDLAKVVMKCNIYARASPENKIQIVRALQDNKQVCSMTGDGVNDAPALKAADIGVGMGITGTAVSKEAAAIILLDDNFATIITAVKEGRRVYDNLRKILIFNQPANFAQGGIVFFALAFQFAEIPLTAIQILYVNLVTSVSLGLFLAMEPAEKDIMSRPPRRPGKRLAGRMFLWRCFWVAVVMICFCLGSFIWVGTLPENTWPSNVCTAYNCTNPTTNVTYGTFFSQVLSKQRAVTMSVLVFAEIGYSLNCRFLVETSITPKIFFGNWVAWACIFFMASAQVFLIYVPGINSFFAMSPIAGPEWGIILLFGVLTFLLVEIEKALIIPVWRPYISPLLFPKTGKEQESKPVKPLPAEKLHGGSMRALSPEELAEVNDV